METLLSACLGLALAAACGFRVFVPLLIVNLAARGGFVELGGSFQWMGSTAALVTFAVATGLEIAAYYVPWLDNLLDTAATPIAVAAGILISASVFTGMDPMVKWSLAVVAGGGLAASTQGITAVVRGLSSFFTGGFGNPIVSTIEAMVSTTLSVLAVMIPVFAFGAALILIALAVRRVGRQAVPSA
jgi:hypothetical protein